LACFTGCFIFGILFLNPVVAFLGAVIATIAEFSRIPVDDNLKIPIASGLAMSFINIFF
jgi:dolichol kinase